MAYPSLSQSLMDSSQTSNIIPAENRLWRRKFVTIVQVLYSVVFSLLYIIGVKKRYKDVKGETVLITGAGSGMGRLLALRFAKLGCRLVLWDINSAGNEETARQVKEIGAKAYTFYCDVSNRENVYDAAKQVREQVGDVTILINNAGIVNGKRLLDTNDEFIEKTFRVNSLAHFWTCKAFLPAMMKNNHGHIVSIASLAGLGGCSRLSDYCSSKYAAVGFEESLRVELAMEGYTGIHSTSICPFYVDTGMFKGVRSKFFPILSPDYVVDKIVDAVLTNKALVIIPGYFIFLVLFKYMVPWSVHLKLYRGLGGDEAMNNFEGRSVDSNHQSNVKKVK